jgi:hypothetical protein
MEKKYTWGGARPNSGGAREGAGRKPINGSKKVHIGFRISQQAFDIIQTKKNKSVFVEDAVIEKEERENNDNQ